MDGDGTEDAYDQDRDGDGIANLEELENGTDPDDLYSRTHKPMVDSLDSEIDDNGTLKLLGQVSTDGNGKIEDFGFVISSGVSLDSSKSKVYWVRATGTASLFTLRLNDMPFEDVLYYRSWAKNRAGYGLSAVKKVKLATSFTFLVG